MKTHLKTLIISFSNLVYCPTFYSEYSQINASYTKLKGNTDSLGRELGEIIDILANDEVIFKSKMLVYSDCSYAYIQLIPLETNFPGVTFNKDD